MPKIHPSELFRALVDAGMIPPDTRRVIIDLQEGQLPIVHVERYADHATLELVRLIGEHGVEPVVVEVGKDRPT